MNDAAQSVLKALAPYLDLAIRPEVYLGHINEALSSTAQPEGQGDTLARLTKERDILLHLHRDLMALAGMGRDTHETFLEWMKLTKDAGERLFALAGRESILLDALADQVASPSPPAGALDREEVARIIDEHVWAKVEVHDGVTCIIYEGVEEAADAILRLHGGEPEGTGHE